MYTHLIYRRAGVYSRRKKQQNFRYTLDERTPQIVGVDVLIDPFQMNSISIAFPSGDGVTTQGVTDEESYGRGV